jgi:hypothetical protein
MAYGGTGLTAPLLPRATMRPVLGDSSTTPRGENEGGTGAMPRAGVWWRVFR